MEIKDKPASMSVREWITRKIAVGIMIPEGVIRLVMTHQFDSAYEALEENNSIEISGFGKFYYNEKKADREIKKCLSQQITYKKILDSEPTAEKKRLLAERQLKVVNKKLEGLWEKQKK